MRAFTVGILIDIDKCIGCHACSIACKVANDVPKRIWFTETITHEEGSFPHVIVHNIPRNRCMHCLNPVCVRACPFDAITKLDEGPVVIDLEKCTGCGICEKECPWHVPDFDADSRKVYMCTLCFERIRTGLEPACVEACPEDAIIFGDRKDLLSKAKETGKHIYGEAEAGGTSVIYISSIPLDQLGFPKVQASVMETHYRKAR